MRTRSYLYLAVVALLSLSLAGCRTKQTAENAAAFTKRQRNEQLIPLAQYPTDVQTMTAKTTITLDYEGHSTTLKGRLRMRRDEVIQMSITALGLVEVASIEFTPKGTYLIDRVNKRYVLLDYSSGLISYAGINFNTVQALFWNRLFIPGEKEAWNNVGNFVLSDTDTQCLVEPSRQRMLKCKFFTDNNYKQLQQTDLTLQQYAASWRYEQFETIDTYTFPTMHDVSVSGDTHAIGAHIDLTGVSILDTGWNGTTDLSRYKKADLEQLMSIIEMFR